MRSGLRLCLYLAVGLVSLTVNSLPAAAQAKDPWAPLSFLLGSWSGKGSGKPGDVAAGTASFSFDLKKNVIVRKNRAEIAAKPGATDGSVHEDLLIIYQQPAGGHFKAIYFDDEGHVINYSVSFPDKQVGAVFESDAMGPGPRFRLTYTLAKNGDVETTFSIAPPGGDYKPYVSGVMTKRS